MKALNIIYNIIIIIVVTTIALVSIALIAPRFFGIQPIAVQTGSMAPTYPQGCMIYVKSIEPEDIVVGDVVTYKLYDEQGTVINNLTHRVIEIDETARTFTTQGDANNTPDNPVSFDEDVSKVVFSVPLVGMVAEIVDTTSGKILAVTIIIVVLIFAFLPDVLRKVDSNEKKKKESDQLL